VKRRAFYNFRTANWLADGLVWVTCDPQGSRPDGIHSNRPVDERRVFVGRCSPETDRSGTVAVPGSLGPGCVKTPPGTPFSFQSMPVEGWSAQNRCFQFRGRPCGAYGVLLAACGGTFRRVIFTLKPASLQSKHGLPGSSSRASYCRRARSTPFRSPPSASSCTRSASSPSST
jgi:hypothetical protein